MIHSFADGHLGCFQYLAIGYVLLGTLGVGVAIREMQIKTTMRHYLTPVRVANKTNQQTNVGEDAEKREP